MNISNTQQAAYLQLLAASLQQQKLLQPPVAVPQLLKNNLNLLNMPAKGPLNFGLNPLLMGGQQANVPA